VMQVSLLVTKELVFEHLSLYPDTQALRGQSLEYKSTISRKTQNIVGASLTGMCIGLLILPSLNHKEFCCESTK